MSMKPLVAEKSETGNPFLFQGLGIIILILKEIHWINTGKFKKGLKLKNKNKPEPPEETVQEAQSIQEADKGSGIK